MTRLVYIDSRAARAAATLQEGDVAVTDVSPLAALPALEGRITDIERLLTQDAANVLGDAAITLALEIDEALRTSDIPARLGLIGGMCQLAGGSSRLASGLMHRAGALALALAVHRPEKIVLATCNLPFLDAAGAPSPTRFGSPFPLLAQHGFFGALPVETIACDIPLPFEGKPDSSVGGLRRIAHLPALSVLYELVSRLGLDRRFGRAGEVVVAAENESLREALPWLVLSGVRIRRIGKALTKPVAVDAPPVPELDGDIVALVQPFAEARLAALGAFTAVQGRAIAAIIATGIAMGLKRVAERLPGLKQRVARELGSGHERRVLLTNGLFGLDGAQLYGLLNAANVTVVDFEHGVTTGLSGHSQRKIVFSEASTCDVVLACCETATAAFGAARRGDKVKRLATGLADQTRHLLRPRLQRALSRRALGLTSRDTVVLHVSTWPHSGNMRPGYGTPTEAHIVDTDRALIEDVYGRIGKRVVYKGYPTQRFIDEPRPADLHRIAPNISFAPDEDLRYVRGAADIIVSASPTSTFGWIAGSGVPVVWLASQRVNPLLATDQDARFAAAFFAIDIDEAGWPDRLRELLAKPLAEIVALWNAKAAARDRLLRETVFGPPATSGRAAAAAVRAIMEGRAA